MTDNYYWEKAEFQDPVAHREHVENYKKGIHSSEFFDEEYAAEAAAELNAQPSLNDVLQNAKQRSAEQDVAATDMEYGKDCI